MHILLYITVEVARHLRFVIGVVFLNNMDTMGNFRFRRMDGKTRLRVNGGTFLDVVRMGDRGGRSLVVPADRCCNGIRLVGGIQLVIMSSSSSTSSCSLMMWSMLVVKARCH